MRKSLITQAFAACLAAVQIALLGMVAASAAETPPPPEAYGPTPSAGQMKYYKDELAAFVHFGVNTFTGKQWGDGKEDPNLFQPDKLDTDQWVSAFKDAGMKRVLITAKHHDGFCLYPSKWTKHSVESSSWRGGKGDVLADLSDSCKKYDMDMGVYLSPWDQNMPCYPTNVEPDYNDAYVGQMEEIFENYGGQDGSIVEFWMDGANGGNNRPKYDIQRWWDTLFRLNPDIVFQQNYGAPLRWVGNEQGYANDESWQTLNKKYVWDLYDQQGKEDSAYLHKGEPYPGGDIWSTPEVDVSIRSGWFYDPNQHPKTPEQLADIYFSSVGLGSPLLLNVPPNKDGLIEQEDLDSLKGFRDILDNTFSKNLADGATAEATATRGNNAEYGAKNVLDGDYDTYWTMDDGQTTGSVTIDLPEPTLMDVIEIQEYIPLGQRISSFQTEVMLDGNWVDYGSGKTIGYKRLVKGNPVVAEKIRVTVTDALAVPLLNNISVYKADERIALAAQAVPGKIEAEDASKVNGRTIIENCPEGTKNLGYVQNGDYALYQGVRFDQTPLKFNLRYSGEGNPQITLRLDSLDGPVIAQLTANSTGSYSSYKTASADVIYDGEITGYHDLYLCLNAGLNVNWFELTGKNTMNLSPARQTVYEGDVAEVTVIRSEEDLSEPVTVQVETAPGTAVHGRHYLDITQTLTFAPGETEQTVQIQTVDNSEAEGDTAFSVLLKTPSGNAVIGSISTSVITIRDNDQPVDKTELDAAIADAEGRQPPLYSPDSWAALLEAKLAAQQVQADSDASQKEVDLAVAALNAALAALKDMQYNAQNPVQLSVAEPVEVEAEFLVPTGIARVNSRAGDSNGKEVEEMGTFQRGVGELEFYFNAPAAGTYEITMRYFTGAQNTMKWSNNQTGALEISGQMAFPFSGSGGRFQESTFAVKVPKAGPNMLRFYNDEAGTCNVDKLTILCTNPIPPEGVDKTILNKVIDRAELLKTGGEYTGAIESVQASFALALESAVLVRDNNYAQQAEVDRAWIALMNEIHKLGFQAGDKTALNELIRYAEGLNMDLYADGAAKQVVAEALKEAYAVVEDGDALRGDVSQAQDNLLEALMNLRFKPDKAILQQLIEKANNIDTAAYTPASVEAFAAAKTAAEALLADETANQEQINAAVSDLEQALAGLVSRGTLAGDSTAQTSSGAPKTGDAAPIALAVALLVLSSAAVWKKRRFWITQ